MEGMKKTSGALELDAELELAQQMKKRALEIFKRRNGNNEESEQAQLLAINAWSSATRTEIMLKKRKMDLSNG